VKPITVVNAVLLARRFKVRDVVRKIFLAKFHASCTCSFSIGNSMEHA
jgi:hypothetical protein